MNDIKEFLKKLPKLDDSHILSKKEQELIEGSGDSCSQTCASGCSVSKKKGVDIGPDQKVR